MKLEASKDRMKVMGRYDRLDEMLYLCYSGAYIEFLFVGCYLEVEMLSDFVSNKEACIMGVYLDGKIHSRLKLNKGIHRYILIDSTERISVKVRLIKLTEVQYATSAIHALFTDDEATIQPTKYQRRKIEFIGDSITCGYGNEGNQYGSFTTEEENAVKSYAILCAEELKADFQLISFSGIGIISRYIEPDIEEPLTDVLMPIIYPYTDWYLYKRKEIKNKHLWNFNEFIADIVVINLGSNDASYIRNQKDRENYFVEEYQKFISTVRKYQPESVIICTIGVMEGKISLVVQKAVSLYKEHTGDNKVHFFEEEAIRSEEGIGTAGHPTVRTHERMAQKLKEYIQENGWLD